MTTCEVAVAALDWIPCSEQDYGDWIRVGMGLHKMEQEQENYDSSGNVIDVLSEWTRWSASDPDRFVDGECGAKWETFGCSSGETVGPATIIEMAKGYGYVPGGGMADVALEWGETAAIDAVTPPPADTSAWSTSPSQMAIEYLGALFKPNEYVAYTVKFSEDDRHPGKWRPYGCYCDRTSEELTDELKELAAQGCDDLGAVFGIPSPTEGGACVCVNPTDGDGRTRESIIEYRHVVAESDEDDRDTFIRVTRQLRLPVSALVDSGNKSVHAIVRVDCGDDAKLYRKRFEAVRAAYASWGITIDKACSNPSRMSRLPGVMRGSRIQALLATDIGALSWGEWEAWYRDACDRPRLPPWRCVQAANPPHRAPVLVEGIMRRGHIGLISAKAKQGKSWLAIMLSVAVATGGEWLGRRCQQGRVLYIDPEIDSRSLSNRFAVVCDAMGVDPALVDRSVYKWSLRGALTAEGKPSVMDDLAHDVVLSGEDLALVVIDSCSCFIGADGDENSSVAVRGLIAHVHRICSSTGAGVLLVHHHGKGLSGDREASDRARGSSVWVDAPDVVLTLTEIVPASGEAAEYIGAGAHAMVLEDAGLREFPATEPTHLIFKYPVHRVDEDGITADWKPRSSSQRGGKAAASINKAKAGMRADMCAAVLSAHFAADESVDELSGTDAAAICQNALGEKVSTQTLKGYLSDRDLSGIAVRQTSAKRWHVVRDDVTEETK